MANTKSAIKTIRRISRQTAVNKARKSRYKNALKKMNLLIESKKKSDALKFLPKLNSELMKVAKTGIVKIDPPPPIKLNIIPIIIALIYPIISIIFS